MPSTLRCPHFTVHVIVARKVFKAGDTPSNHLRTSNIHFGTLILAQVLLLRDTSYSRLCPMLQSLPFVGDNLDHLVSL
ncbi:hypothetical protein BAUCODRAFT_305358 [Baudoinia panamericana UAMH 10762]|uniref:Uncharacterized protein n=1 Tax=Baudoinia panamericana (strain UAMH 10762) TaxID=717646 RepID=M2M585_BAUPA|nr:uncharacterized protein BAUCODRAFT_305358 [Baudoinia panamericana UAMH 10762]EMC91786.1 hypothetical protein BAUCODRAFT_305358 [Baudoinia panamericana UAMH 10762]